MELMLKCELGQWRNIEDFLPMKKNVDWSDWHADLDTIGEILSKHMVNGINGWNSSLGIHQEITHENARRAYDIHQVLRNKVAWDTHDPVTEPVPMRNDFDRPYATSDWGLPEIKNDDS